MRAFIGALIGGVIFVLAVSWLVEGNDFFLFQYFAPRRAAVERKVFEETKSYNQGMIQELENMQFQYEQADDAHKEALRSIILHRAADYDVDKLPPSLRSFVAGLRRAQ